MIPRRDFLRLLSVTFAAPLPVLRSAFDPLRSVPTAIANLSLLELIGWRTPALEQPRWSDAKLLHEPAEALESLSRAAKADGVDCWARSGHRSLRQQRYLWNARYRGQEDVRWTDGRRAPLDATMSPEERVRQILGYTAFPGTSRHHWGTDVDIAQSYGDHCADLLLSRAAGSGGEGGANGGATSPREADCLPVQRWLAEHAAEYGWCLVYDVGRGGFQPEPWHWSYLSFAVPALARYMEEVTADLLRDRDVDGDTVVLDDFEAYRQRYLLGVHPSALPAAEEAAEEAPEGAGSSTGSPAARISARALLWSTTPSCIR
jgi:LAS superfamily LD-carboxypeptidase LdcB